MFGRVLLFLLFLFLLLFLAFLIFIIALPLMGFLLVCVGNLCGGVEGGGGVRQGRAGRGAVSAGGLRLEAVLVGQRTVLQSEAGQLESIERDELLEDGGFVDEGLQGGVGEVRGGVEDAGERGQEGGERVLHLLASELVVGVLEAVVGHEVGGAGETTLLRLVLHEVEGRERA